MQFHHHGYVTHDPRIRPAQGTGVDRPADLPDEVDVLIVGSGPAGMIAAAQLAQFPDVTTRIVERRPGRLEMGQADGIQARSVETFQAFGFAERITAEAYRITEMAFWKPDPDHPENIVRTRVVPDDPHGITEFPHLIVNQARVLDYFAEVAAHSPARLTPDHGWEFLDLTVSDDADPPAPGRRGHLPGEAPGSAARSGSSSGGAARGVVVGDGHPVTVTLRRTAGPGAGTVRTVRAKFVLGADGARSAVRAAIGRELAGDQANHAWGVIDVLAVTDFPDVRTKCAIQSHDGGSILLIPREGGFLCRWYVDLGEVSDDDAHAVRNTPVAEIVEHANRILHPYRLDVKDVPWHSVYEVGHRLTDKFDDVPAELTGTRVPRVFIAGDACHTHSAKAGQGMNVSMQDGWNIAWKLGHVLTGRAPASLLDTYSAERQVVARNLIEFDREWSSLMAARPEDLPEPGYLEDFYVQTTEFLFGFRTEYGPSTIVGGAEHQGLAAGFPVGKRFKSAPVVRVADGNPVHLGHHARADGRWRIYAFADDAAPAHRGGDPEARPAESTTDDIHRGGDPDAVPAHSTPDGARRGADAGTNPWAGRGDGRGSETDADPTTPAEGGPAAPRLAAWAEWMASSPESPLVRCTPADADPDSVIEVKVIHQRPHSEVELAEVPEVFLPRVGPFGLIDYEKVYATDPADDIFTARGISRAGAVVVVRPDQYVAAVLPLTATSALADFLAGALLPA